MNAVDSNFQAGSLAFLPHVVLHFFLRFLYHFFDSGRMNSSVHNQTFQCNSGNLPANGIKSGKHYCFRRIVDNQFHARERLQSPYVPSLTADNPAFHLIVGKLYNGNRCLSHMIRRTALNGCHNQISCLLVRLFLCLILKFLN